MMDPRPKEIIDADAKETGPRFMGIPDRWYENPHWRCEKGHVSVMILRSESGPRDKCLACRSPVWLTFPEDHE